MRRIYQIADIPLPSDPRHSPYFQYTIEYLKNSKCIGLTISQHQLNGCHSQVSV